MAKWMLNFFVEIIFLITANKKCDALKNHYEVLCSPEKNAPDTECVINHVRSMFRGIEFFMLTPKFLYTYLPNYNKLAKEFLNSFDWMRNYYIHNIIKERREEIEKIPVDQELSPDMLTMMITFNTSRDKSSIDQSLDPPISNEDICYNIMEIIAAGIDTSSNSFCFIIYYLCRYPKVKQRVFEEIQNVFDLNSSFSVNYEDLSKLHYCEAVIKEVARHKTITPLNPRLADNADEINGHKFKGLTQIFILNQQIHMHKSYWKEPEKFKPERFLSSKNNNDNHDKIKKNSFMMFGGGSRICPGRHLAMTEIKTLMVLLFSKYDIQLVDPSAPLKTHGIAANQCGELKIKLFPRN